MLASKPGTALVQQGDSVSTIAKPKLRNEHGLSMVDLMIWISVAAIIMMVGLQGIITYTNIAKNDQVKAVGKVLQQWSVANPDKPLPVTAGYIDYENFETSWLPTNVNFSGDIVGNDKARKIRITKIGTGASDFAICSYTETTSKRSKVDYMLYNSSTNKIEKDDPDYCKQ